VLGFRCQKEDEHRVEKPSKMLSGFVLAQRPVSKVDHSALLEQILSALSASLCFFFT
jgi:hypothetical protein